MLGLEQATADILERAYILANDRDIVSWEGSRIAGVDKENPRVEVEIEEIKAELFQVITEGIPIPRLEEICQAEQEKRLVVLPVPIGAPIYTTYHYLETNGEEVTGVEEAYLSGYIKEDEREFYATYDQECTNDIPLDRVYVTRAEAEAALMRKGVKP